MTSTALLTIDELSKTFPGQKALDSVHFELEPNEIHALVGQNGSGKSTFIKILAGYHDPDPGAEATIDGRTFRLGDPVAAFGAGLRFVHQDLGLAPTLGTLDNLALGRGYLRGRTGTISWRREAREARKLLGSLGYDFDITAPVSSLAAAERTGVAIARALEGWEEQARILVLDEPTASLPAAEVDRLFSVLRMVHREGVALIYVSHHFGEVFEISERITVLRDGAVVATEVTTDLDESQLIELTIGRALSSLEALPPARPGHRIRRAGAGSARALARWRDHPEPRSGRRPRGDRRVRGCDGLGSGRGRRTRLRRERPGGPGVRRRRRSVGAPS